MQKTTPLHFCTGVVLIELPEKLKIRFRPLHFCTGVVQKMMKEGKNKVLDPCIFARV